MEIQNYSSHLLKRQLGNFFSTLSEISNTFPDTLIRIVPGCCGGLSSNASTPGFLKLCLRDRFPRTVFPMDLEAPSDHLRAISCVWESALGHLLFWENDP